ncbi:MAG TPA: 4Fe-4S dicluster domain-containing protein [Candidatus Angelobacter sp.]|nr:4Fe-4S dicluster domain-containing protein [Candidatus Angelobacter sp.]
MVTPRFLPRAELDRLVQALAVDGRSVIGPVVRDGALSYAPIGSAADLPHGWTDDQAPGSYRLRAGDARTFDVGPPAQGLKRFTYPSRLPTLTSTRDAKGATTFTPAEAEAPRLAFLGVRACEIAGLLVQDRVLAGGPFVDEDYRARRDASFVAAVQCTRAGGTCFCASMGTGPEVTSGHDLVLTELEDGFVVDAGSADGAHLLERLELAPADAARLDAASAGVASARAAQGRPVVTEGLRDRLMDQLDHPRWADVADRCLACSNCTMVCPTCFCASVAQVSDLDGAVNGTERRWDSCFTGDFARVAGGNFRPRRQDRYRQWLTHKFATWIDQFGTSGCVGCGRCITWCPVGIDVREELAAIAPPYEAILDELPVIAGGATSFVVGTVRSVTPETADTSTLALVPADDGLLAARPGQFVMIQLPGHPPLPISVSRVADGALWLTIRAAGAATAAIIGLRAGMQVGLRGPLGRGWPVERAVGRDVVVVAGGIGLAPLRPLIDALRRDRTRFGSVVIAYGARTPADRLYPDEMAAWSAEGIEVLEIVDRAGPEWLGRVGIVTQLLDQRDWRDRPSAAFVVGPERMMEATVATLAERGIGRDRIFVSLERHMECGVGLCGHCQMGPFFICRDGPVFSVGELGDLFGREGL